ncbi:hypothetical protein DK846_04085 [Methanospirillum lacunae]|uniref:Uncharacterized protein n=2 Tax=Methanospirillum lacunae TaxID=668570 RepID=A0A2V2N752_9EURY|nr:hypothetical protein DK846_04085 [Methanospirillum lacunae]
MQNYDTLKISIQKRNDSTAEEHKIANIKKKRAKLLKQQNDIREDTLKSSLKIQKISDTVDLNFIPVSPSSQEHSIPSANLTFGHLKPVEQRKQDPMEFQKIGEFSTKIPFGYQNPGGSVYNKVSERVKNLHHVQ